MIKILFIGDIVGKLGRQTVEKVLPSLKRSARVDLVIANAENLNHGKGASKERVQEMINLGIDAFTSGNHIFAIDSFADEIDELPVARPANWPEATPGKDRLVIDLGKKGKVLILNFIGRVFSDDECSSSAMITAEKILEEVQGEKYSAILVDFHGEATSEKAAFAYNFDGRISAFFGTHTHVSTADQRILPKGTAFVTDVGMVGSLNSSLGVSLESVIPRYKLPLPTKFEWNEEGEAVFNSVLVEIGESGKALKIERIDKFITK